MNGTPENFRMLMFQKNDFLHSGRFWISSSSFPSHHTKADGTEMYATALNVAPTGRSLNVRTSLSMSCNEALKNATILFVTAPR